MLNIYFAGAIRGGRDDTALYGRLIDFLGRYGVVLTDHVGNERLLEEERSMSEAEIFGRDLAWMERADLMVAEVTTPSLGVGYEIAVAVARGLDILCLYRPGPGRSLSALIGGCPALTVKNYEQPAEAERLLGDWLAARSGERHGRS